MDIERIVALIEPVDNVCQDDARKRQDQLTKPQGSLGRLEDLSIQLAGIYRNCMPTISKKVIFTMAADHGVAIEGVSAYPSEVTAQMVLNFASGGAAINVIARHVGAEVRIVDMGVASSISWPPCVLNKKVGPGTRNMAKERAMSRDEAKLAIIRGAELALQAVEEGANLIGIGDMGIGNTTSASAITAVVTGKDLKEVVGRGTGIDDAHFENKIRIISRAIQLHHPDPEDPIDILECVGGFEIAGMAGVILGAASKKVPVVLDGFISGSAALIANGLSPMSRAYMIASHKSVENGHDAILRHLGLRPLLDFNMRLGEGTGAALAMPIIEASCKILTEMATFESAGVSKKRG
ncbi:MAG: nicotinate-nucleotide--dimethylbenzimidazole phosphoribosyltransferase [Thermoplasmata archaeon]